MVAKAETQPSPNSTMPMPAGSQWRDTASTAIPAQEKMLAMTTMALRSACLRNAGRPRPDTTPPAPITPRIRPYMPAPSPSCSRTTRGSSAQGAAAGSE